MPEFSLQEIVPGIRVALGGVCNRGIIDQGGEVLSLPDTFFTARRETKKRNGLMARWSPKPRRGSLERLSPAR